MRKTALITGATSGIGRATALILAENNFNLIICGRRKERLDELESEIGNKAEVLKLSFDVSKRAEVEKILTSLPENWRNIDLLLNNAGNAHGLSPIQEGDVDDWDAMIDINVKGLLYVSRTILPLMIAKGRGHVINIGSIAGKEVYPNGNVYCASKFAVDALSNAMRFDLNKHGIKVSEINPGMVETEFSKVRFKGDDQRASTVYQGLKPLTAQDIADIILFVVNRPAHVNISDLVVLPTAQASATVVKRENI